MRTERFWFVMSDKEKAMLNRLAEHEMLPKAAVLRRLVREAVQTLWPPEQCKPIQGRGTGGDGAARAEEASSDDNS